MTESEKKTIEFALSKCYVQGIVDDDEASAALGALDNLINRERAFRLSCGALVSWAQEPYHSRKEEELSRILAVIEGVEGAVLNAERTPPP